MSHRDSPWGGRKCQAHAIETGHRKQLIRGVHSEGSLEVFEVPRSVMEETLGSGGGGERGRKKESWRDTEEERAAEKDRDGHRKKRRRLRHRNRHPGIQRC